MCILSLYSSYSAFHRPCHSKADIGSTSSVKIIQSRGPKDKPTFNAYTEGDDLILIVSALDLFAALLLILSTIVFCIDVREQAIEDE